MKKLSKAEKIRRTRLRQIYLNRAHELEDEQERMTPFERLREAAGSNSYSDAEIGRWFRDVMFRDYNNKGY